MKTDQTAWIVLSVGLNCYEDSDQTLIMTEML